jgi:uncharacterized membrane protein
LSLEPYAFSIAGMGNPLRWRGHEVSRLEGFSDTVFAFALTLLVVALEVPHSYEKLIHLMMGFPAFACCFALLVWIWAQHNAFFRRFGLQDAYTIVLNGALLFVVLLYVYPLKFMFDAMFSQWLPTETGAMRMELYQLANASAIYASGFIAVFVLFGLLYHHAYASREQLQLSELEAFDARAAIGHHAVSVSVGVLSLLIALLAPLPLVPFAPTIFFLMGPGHFWYGSRSGGQRRAIEARLAEASPAASE